MKIIIEEKLSEEEEDTIIIRCTTMQEPLLRLIQSIKASNEELIGIKDAVIHRIPIEDVYYFEAVDHKVFIYTKSDVYEARLKLYEVEERYSSADCLRVSKSVILNLRKVRSFFPVLGGRMEAALDNGEKVILSRQYVPLVKNRLGL